MPPYKPIVSKAQGRLLFAKEERGEIAKGEAEGKAHAAGGFKGLPERVGAKHAKHAAMHGLKSALRRTP